MAVKNVKLNVTILQTVSCENEFANAHVRAHFYMCQVRAKMTFKTSVPCAWDVRLAIAILHTFGQKRPDFAIFFEKRPKLLILKLLSMLLHDHTLV